MTKQAAELVSEAKQQMKRASEKLAAETIEVAEARPPQDNALENLIEAIEKLKPPQEHSPTNSNNRRISSAESTTTG